MPKWFGISCVAGNQMQLSKAKECQIPLHDSSCAYEGTPCIMDCEFFYRGKGICISNMKCICHYKC